MVLTNLPARSRLADRRAQDSPRPLRTARAFSMSKSLDFVRLTVRIPRCTKDRLGALAIKRKASLAALARQAIDDFVNRERRDGEAAPRLEVVRQQEQLRLLRTKLTART